MRTCQVEIISFATTYTWIKDMFSLPVFEDEENHGLPEFSVSSCGAIITVVDALIVIWLATGMYILAAIFHTMTTTGLSTALFRARRSEQSLKESNRALPVFAKGIASGLL